MRKFFLALLLSMMFILPALTARAEEPVKLTHTLVGQTEGVDTVTLNFTILVENHSETTYQSLKLNYVPLSLIAVEEVSVTVGDVPAGQSVDVSFSILTPKPFLEEQSVLPWVGEYTSPDGTGSVVDFPATSYAAGGAI